MPIQAPQWTEFLTCPICYNEFDEHSRQPISLGCGHTLCDSCLSNLHRTQCPFDQATVETDVKQLPFNYALLQLVGFKIPEDTLPSIQCIQDNPTEYREAKRCIEELAQFLQPVAGTGYGSVNGSTNGIGCNGTQNGNGNNVLTRPMQRKLVTLVNCQLAEAEGRTRAMRAARSLGERTVTELILLHQNQQQLSANLWSAVRNRGCQFLGPAMQEEALKLILLALEGGEALSRKVLVLFVVQKLEPVFTQASKTSIGHVVQLLYRASCFKVTKRDDDSSLMQLKELFRTYDALRKEHDAQIVQIATEAGLRILPDQWSSLLYGDLDHKSHMQSIIDKLQSPTSFSQSIQELIIALQRSGDPGNLSSLRENFELLSTIDASPEATCPDWSALEEAMKAVHSVVHGLVTFQRMYGNKMRGSSDPPQNHNNKFKTSMCRDFQRGGCPRGVNCTFAHSEEELDRYSRRRTPRPRPLASRGPSSSVPGAGPDQYSPQAPIENGSESNPAVTQALASCANGSSRSSPQFVTAGPVDMPGTACYGQPPPQLIRRGSQEQLQIMSQRMKQMSIQTPQAVYQPEGAYCPPRSPYEHVPPQYASPSGSDRGLYGYYSQSAPPGNSYSGVVSRGEGKIATGVLPQSGVMTPPRNSPLTVQDEGLNGLANGHIDPLSGRLNHSDALYKHMSRRDMSHRRDLTPVPPGATNYPAFDPSYNGAFASDPGPYYSQPEYYSSQYGSRPAASYEPMPPRVMGYHMATGTRRDMGYNDPYYHNGYPYHYELRDGYPLEMNGMNGRLAVKRSPYIPDMCDDIKTPDSSSPRSSDTGDENTLSDKMPAVAECELLDSWLGYKISRKDTTLSSASSGVSSGSPLSHSPAASQSSNSSLSPRQQSPVGWQHGNDAEYIWRNFADDSNTLPPPPALTESVPIWRRGNEVSRLWGPLINLDEWSRSEEQIKKDEQLARCLQEMEQTGTTTPPETSGCELTLQTLDNEEQQSGDQGRRGQDAPGLSLDTREDEAEVKRRKRAEHQRLLQERRKLLQKQEKERQERDDRKFAEEIAFRDAQQAGLVPDPRCIMKPYNPNVISRGPPLGLGFSSTEEEIPGGCDAFGELKNFRGSCASSLANDDDVIDASKMTSGCAGDIRVQE